MQSLVCRVAAPDWYQALQVKNGTVQSLLQAGERRQFPRFHCVTKAILTCRGNLPALPRSADRYIVLCKDISRNGIAFLHEAEMFPEEELSLWLPLGLRSYIVQRCRRLQERCYEVGAKAGGRS